MGNFFVHLFLWFMFNSYVLFVYWRVAKPWPVFLGVGQMAINWCSVHPPFSRSAGWSWSFSIESPHLLLKSHSNPMKSSYDLAVFFSWVGPLCQLAITGKHGPVTSVSGFHSFMRVSLVAAHGRPSSSSSRCPRWRWKGGESQVSTKSECIRIYVSQVWYIFIHMCVYIYICYLYIYI